MTKTSVRPANRHHRRQLMIDAIAKLDMAEMHRLVRDHAANVNDIQLSIAQTERADDEVMDAYEAWLKDADVWEKYSVEVQHKTRNFIRQQPLFPVAQA